MRRLGALLAVLVAASIAAACGEGALSSEEQPTGGQLGGRLHAEKKASKSSMERGRSAAQKASKLASDEGSPGTAVDEMSVFSRPRTDADVLPDELSYVLKNHHCGDWQRSHGGCLGDAVADESRLLLKNLGVQETSLYAWPTTNGWVCWAMADGGGGCVHDFTQVKIRTAFMGIDPDELGVGYPGTLVGVVPDDVAAADIQVQRVRYAATVERNGIFYELPDGACTSWAFESLTVTYRGGGSDTVPIKWHHGPTRLDGRALYPAGELNPACVG